MQQPRREAPKDKNRLLDELRDMQAPRSVHDSRNRRPDGENPEQNPWLAFGMHLDRLFEIPVYDAPGLSLVGAQVDPTAFGTKGQNRPASATGKALDTCNATLSCIGEAVEFTSQHLRGDEPIVRAMVPRDAEYRDKQKLERLLELAGYRLADTGRQRNWVRTLRLHDGADAWLPAELFYRGLPDAGTPPLSKPGLGCASGPALGWAMLHGLLELIERDAVALWWIGGAAARPISLESPGMNRAADILCALRAKSDHRRTILLDITTDLGVPCVVAASHNSDGRGLAFGFGARSDLAEAASAAILEMTQMEMAVHIVKMKRQQQGESALNSEEQMTLRRYNELDVVDITLNSGRFTSSAATGTHPSATPESWQAMPDRDQAIAIANHLNQYGIEVFALDITRPEIAVPAVKLTSADLQPMPSEFQTARLRTMLAVCGGGPSHKRGIELF